MQKSNWHGPKRSVQFLMLMGAMLAAGLILVIPVAGYALNAGWREGGEWGLYLLFAVCSVTGICMGLQQMFWNGVAVRGPEIRLRRGGILPREYIVRREDAPSMRLEHSKKTVRYDKSGRVIVTWHAYRLALHLADGRTLRSGWLYPDLDAMRGFMNNLPPRGEPVGPNGQKIRLQRRFCRPLVALDLLCPALCLAGLAQWFR